MRKRRGSVIKLNDGEMSATVMLVDDGDEDGGADDGDDGEYDGRCESQGWGILNNEA